jgi:hypothetical protein
MRAKSLAISAAFVFAFSIPISNQAAFSQQNICYSHRDEANPILVKCEVRFVDGSIFSIKDLSDGNTFQIGENGLILVSGTNCIRNIESASTFCLSS